MNYCDLNNLNSVMMVIEATFTEAETQYVCSSILKALSFLHQNKMIHRGDYWPFSFKSLFLLISIF